MAFQDPFAIAEQTPPPTAPQPMQDPFAPVEEQRPQLLTTRILSAIMPQDTATQFTNLVDREKQVIKGTWQQTRDEFREYGKLGQGVLTGDGDLTAEGMQNVAQLRQKKSEIPADLTVGEKILSGTTGVAAELINGERWTAFVDEFTAGARSEFASPYSPAAAALGVTAADQNSLAGIVAYDLSQVVDSETGEPLPPEIIKEAAIYAGTAGGLLNFVTFGQGGKIANKAFQNVVGEGKREALQQASIRIAKMLTGKEFVPKFAKGLKGYAKEVATLTPLMTTGSLLPLVVEESAKAYANFTLDSNYDQADRNYIKERMADALEQSFLTSLGIPVAIRTTATVAGAPVKAYKARVPKKSNLSVGELEAAWAEREAAPKEQEFVELSRDRLTDQELADIGVVTDEFLSVDDGLVEQTISDELMMKDGTPAGISRQQYMEERRSLTQQRQELYGVPELRDAEGNVTRPAEQGLTSWLRQLRREERRLKEEGVKTKDPERALVREEIARVKQEVKDKKAALEDTKNRVRSMYIPEDLVSQQRLAAGKEALSNAQRTAEKGFLEGEEITKDDVTQFREDLKKARREYKAAETAGDKEGMARGKALVRQIINNKRARMQNTATRNKVIGNINKLVRRGAKKTGELTAEANAVFTKLREIVNLKTEEAQDRLMALDDAASEGVSTAIERGLLKLKAGSKNLTLKQIGELDSALTDFFENANFERLDTILQNEVEIARKKAGLMEDLLGPEWKKEVAKFKQQERVRPQDNQPLSLYGRFRKAMLTPGWGAIRNWHGIGRVLSGDVFKAYEDTAIGRLFETIIPERESKNGLNNDVNEFYSLLSEIYPDAIKQGSKFSVEKFIVNETMADEAAIRGADGNPILIVDEFGNESPVLFTRFERIHRAAELMRPGMKEHFKMEQGWTDELIAAVQDLNAQDQRFMQGMLDFYARMYDKVNAVFSELNGFNLEKRDFYVPVLRTGFEQKSSLTPLLQDLKDYTQARGSTSGRIKKASVNSKREVVKQNALQAMYLYSRDMNHYIAWAKKAQELNSVLRDPEVVDGIQAKFGTEMGKALVREMNDNLQVLSRGFADPKLDRTFFDIIRSNIVRAQLAGKVIIGVKQLSSMGLYAAKEGMSTAEFISGVAEFMRNPKQSVEVMQKRSQYIKERGLDFDRDLVSSVFGMERKKWDKKGTKRLYEKAVSDFLMKPIYYGDKAAVYAGGYSLYRHLLKTMRPEEAMTRVEAYIRDTQQSTELSTQSRMQRSTDPLAKLATTYSTATFSMIRLGTSSVTRVVHALDARNAARERVESLRMSNAPEGEIQAAITNLRDTELGLSKSKMQAAKAAMAVHVLTSGSFTLLSQLGNPDLKELLAGIALGPFGAVPIFGDGLEWLVRKAVGVSPYQDVSIINAPLREIGGAVQDLWNTAVKGEDLDPSFFRRAAGGLQTVTPLPLKWFTDLMDSLINDLPEGEEKKTIATALGASKGTVEKYLSEE